MSLEPSTSVVHLELHTAQLARARAFYGAVCGWEPDRIRTRAGSYLALELGGGLGGGMVECGTRRPLWLRPPAPTGRCGSVPPARCRPARSSGSSRAEVASPPSGSDDRKGTTEGPVAASGGPLGLFVRRSWHG